tara:strand:+ start:388 stop:858 length:471 start_codon:yes stop_codon:yes gene_type:complete
MSKKKHYILEEVDEEDYKIIAIHSYCEDYRMAYLINANCNSKFLKSKQKISASQPEGDFQVFEWNDRIKGIECYLFSNRSLIFQNDNQNDTSLFNLPETKELYLVQDLKEADYILKINSGIDAASLAKKLEIINEVSYCYLPDQSKINLDLCLNFD